MKIYRILNFIAFATLSASAFAITPKTDILIEESETNVMPSTIIMSQLTDKSTIPAQPWTGFDPKRYSDIAFYDGDGKTHLKGRIINYSPNLGFSSFSIQTYDKFRGKDQQNVCEIEPDGSFEIDLPVHYPQYNQILIGHSFKNIFLIPGDTIAISLSFSPHTNPAYGYFLEHFGFEGEPDDAVAVNILADSLIDKSYGLKNLYQRFHVDDTDSMKADTYRNIDRVSEFLDSVVTDLPVLLRNLPISTFAKDYLSVYAIAKICNVMDDLEVNFMNAKGDGPKMDENGKFQNTVGNKLDPGRVVESRLRHKDFLYGNPLMVGINGFMVSQWDFGSIFGATAQAAVSYREAPDMTGKFIKANDIDALYDSTLNRLDSIGVGNCFAAQLVRNMRIMAKMDSKTEIPSSRNLKITEYFVSKANQNCSYGRLKEFLMQEYDKYEKKVMDIENSMDAGSDNSIMIDGSTDGDVFEKIVAQYRGNVLYIDFWGINCAPCHAAMIRQKPMIDKLADKPFKVLYIATASERMDDGKKWLKSAEIKGEHIFVTDDDWKRLFERFNFSDIPFGILVDKDGKVIKTHYRFFTDEPLLQKALEDE